MAFLPSYGTGFGYSAFPQQQYAFAPTAFASVAPHQAAEQHEGSQAGDHASQAVSTSGFGAENGAVFYGQPFAGQAFAGQPLIYGAQQTVIPSTTLVPVGVPRVRRPGYNERLIAWRNRQKAFNRYKKAAKEAIKNASRAQFPQQQFAAPAYYGATGFGAPTYFGAAPFGGATYISGYPAVFDQGFAAQAAPAEHQEAYGTFGDFSQASQGHQEAVEEPEIRGTQV